MKCPQPIYIGCGDQNQLSKAQRTNRCPGDYELLHYSADITAGSLKVQESRIVADLLLRGVDATGWKAAIVMAMTPPREVPSTTSLGVPASSISRSMSLVSTGTE